MIVRGAEHKWLICPVKASNPSCSALKRVGQLSGFKENCWLVVELSEFRHRTQLSVEGFVLRLVRKKITSK
jgi:hypothetical protein